jgi:excisionase family DNA binding protein
MLEEYPDVLSINETMEILGISRNLLYNLIHTGAIPAMRIGKKLWRINKQALIKYIEES